MKARFESLRAYDRAFLICTQRRGCPRFDCVRRSSVSQTASQTIDGMVSDMMALELHFVELLAGQIGETNEHHSDHRDRKSVV